MADCPASGRSEWWSRSTVLVMPVWTPLMPGRLGVVGAGAGGVEPVVERPAAVGHLGQGGPHPAFAVGDDLVERGSGQGPQAGHADLVRPPLGVEVAAPFGSGAGVGEQHRLD